MENNEVVLILAVHVNDPLVYGNETVCEELVGVLLNGQFSTQNLGDLDWYLGCAVEREWEEGAIKIRQPAMIDTLLACFDVKHSSSIPASPTAQLGPTTDDYVVTDRPFRQAEDGVMWLTGMARPPGIAYAARAVAHHSHYPCERYWVAVEKTLAYLSATRDLGITYERGNRVSLTVFAYADYASKVTGRHSISGVAVMLGGATVCVIGSTQHYVVLPTTKA